MDGWQSFQVYTGWCVVRGQQGLCPHCGLLLLSVSGIHDACLCLCMLATVLSISGLGRYWGGIGQGSMIAVPRLLAAL